MAIPGAIANLAMYVGEDRLFNDTIYKSDGVTPQDVTGWAVSFTVHAYGDPTTVFISKTTGGGGITLLQPTAGVIQISVAQADTINMNPGQYEYAIERTNPSADAVPTKGLFTLAAK